LTVEARPGGIIAGDVKTDYTRFEVGATYRFLKGPVEIGARFRFEIDNRANLLFNPMLPIRIHAAKIVRIDTGVNFTGLVPTKSCPTFALPGGGSATSAGCRDDAAAGLTGIYTDFLRPAEAGIPLDIAFQIVEPAFIGLSTGYGIADFAHNVGDESFMPLGVF